jgi:hypothetical protein
MRERSKRGRAGAFVWSKDRRAVLGLERGRGAETGGSRNEVAVTEGEELFGRR